MAGIPPPPTSTLDTNSNSNGPTPGMAMGANLGNSARAATPSPGVYLQSDMNKITPMKHQGRGLLRVVGNDEMAAAEKKSISLAKADEETMTELARYIRDRFEKAVRHRRVIFIDDELITAMRAYNGQYDPGKLSEIRAFGGSEVYTRLITTKCRGATALLRNVYMNSDRSWSLMPTADPVIPDNIDSKIKDLIANEVRVLNSQGQTVDENMIKAREQELYEAAKLNELRKAETETKEAEKKIDKLLEEGKFYVALSEFLSDLPVYRLGAIT